MELKLNISYIFPLPLFSLLIVPYGIETTAVFIYKSVLPLLIVPYGIETHVHYRCHHLTNTFNCTLWN